ncbi:MAG: lipid II:glycine glycyltransferase FemX [Anaerolineae bacterium]
MASSEPGSSSSPAELWNAKLRLCDPASILQTYQWGQLKNAFGWSVHRYSGKAGMAQLLVRTTPAGKIAYVPRGPALYSPHERTQAMAEVVDELHSICQRIGAITLKLEPQCPHDESTVAILQRLGFRPSFQSVQPGSTVVVDVSGSEDDVLARMRSKTRYNTRLASRKGVRVRLGEGNDLPVFARLVHETGQRDGFAVHPRAYYERAYDLFSPLGMAALLLAEYNNEILAGLMVFAFAATAYYLYGASSGRYRDLMPTYALQWEAIRWARAQGCTTYDLWGVPDEVGRAPGDYLDTEVPARQGLWGVWRFKRGFGGRVVRYVGTWDYVYKPIGYRLYHWLFRLREKLGESRQPH